MLRRGPILAFACFFAASAVADGGRRDQDEARAAVESGAILPLEAILARVKTGLNGEIVKVKLEHEHGAWIYEFRVVDGRGRLREVVVDAATGAIRRDLSDGEEE